MYQTSEPIAAPPPLAHDLTFEDLSFDAPIGYQELDEHGGFMRVNRTELLP